MKAKDIRMLEKKDKGLVAKLTHQCMVIRHIWLSREREL